MDQEVKKLLEENIRISKENNELLLKIRNVQRWAQITRYLYWFVIIAVSFGAFYFVQPYLENLLNLYTGGVGGSINVSDIGKNLTDQQGQIQDLIKSLNN
jgi:hypothetical protein